MKRPTPVTRKPIDIDRVMASVRDDSAGGTVVFLGTVRKKSEGKAVRGLTYEVYKEMAERKMGEIEAAVRERWPVVGMAIVHRYGSLEVGEISVVVAVSCEHRAEAFEACSYAIEAIKKSLPLWKKERFKGGDESWVKGSAIVK